MKKPEVKKKPKTKNIGIEEKAFNVIKKYADENDVIMGKFVAKASLEKIKSINSGE